MDQSSHSTVTYQGEISKDYTKLPIKLLLCQNQEGKKLQ